MVAQIRPLDPRKAEGDMLTQRLWQVNLLGLRLNMSTEPSLSSRVGDYVCWFLVNVSSA